jgi:hypothetical protein
MFPERSALLNPDDTYTRLPAPKERFEEQMESSMPFFDACESQVARLKSQDLNVAGFLVEVIHLWSTCRKVIDTSLHREHQERRLKQALSKLDVLAQRLEDWHIALPAEMLFSWENLEIAESAGHFGSFLAAHLYFHDAIIKLNRFRQQVGNTPLEELVPILHKACDHTKMVFELVACVDQAIKAKPVLSEVLPPALPAVTQEAVNMLVAQGPIERCGEMIESVVMSKRLVDSMCCVWKEAAGPAEAIALDLERLYHMRQTGVRMSDST